RFSIAAFSAWLSSRIAPSTDRSASRLFGSGFSKVASAGINAQKASLSKFAFSSLLNHNLRVLASVGIFISATNTSLFGVMRHCAWKPAVRQLACLCIASEISAKLFLLPLLCSALQCVALRQTCIQVLGLNPNFRSGESRWQR